MAKDEKIKVLNLALGSIEKRYGKGAIMRLGESKHLDVSTIPTGALTLDIATGIGGVPRGRVVEIFGPESSGKTTLTLHIIAEAQKKGGIAAFIDVEHALDPTYAKRLGVDIENLYISQPDNGEQALEIAEQLVRSGALDIVVIDSVAALVPRAEIEGEMGDSHMGLQARLMSQALRKLTGCIKKSNTCVIFVNQIRYKIGVFFGNPETTTGGNALKFYCSMRFEIRRIQTIKSANDPVGIKARVKIVKNKLAAPFKTAEFNIMYNEGISQTGCIIDVAVNDGIIEKSGSWFSYGKDRLGQGVDNVSVFLEENPKIKNKILKEIYSKHGIITGDVTNTDKDGAKEKQE